MRSHRLTVAVYLLLLTTTAAFASDPIRLDAPGGSMEHVPETSQDGIGDCYAHAGTAMAEAWKFSRSADPMEYPAVSVTEAAVTTMTHNGLLKTHSAGVFFRILTHRKATVEGGEICDVVDSLMKHGGCPASDAPDVDPRSEDLKTVQREFNQSCQKNRISFPKGRCIKFLVTPGDGVLDKLLERKDAQPIGLGIDAYMLTLGREFNRSMYVGDGISVDYHHFRFIHYIPVFSRLIDTAVGYSRGHAVLVIGKRVKNGRTQYLLRNTTPIEYPSDDWDWENGDYHNVWVDGDILMQAVLSASIIQPR